MARKPKPRKVPIVNKEYIWDLEVENDMHEFKVFVGEDECITYEDGVESKHLKIMDKTQMQGVLQIDCKTKVFDEITDFQLENGIPYIKVENDEGPRKWRMSDTTREDRIQHQIKKVKKEAYVAWACGLVFVLWCVIQFAVTGTLGEWPIAPVFACFCILTGFINMIRLKNELEAMGRPFSWKLEK